MSSRYTRNRTLMWILFAVLVVLHHDFWFWDDSQLVFGFLPIGLGYQILISIAASALWGGTRSTPGPIDTTTCPQACRRRFTWPLSKRARIRRA